MRNSKTLNKTTDLKIMVLAGLTHNLISIKLLSLDTYQQLLVCLFFSAIAGLLVKDRSQLIEWPLFFVFGGMLGTVFSYLDLMIYSPKFSYWSLVIPTMDTAYWFGFLLTSWILGLPLGMLVHRYSLGKDYWVRKSFFS